jgi:hypothetical protein
VVSDPAYQICMGDVTGLQGAVQEGRCVSFVEEPERVEHRSVGSSQPQSLAEGDVLGDKGSCR